MVSIGSLGFGRNCFGKKPIFRSNYSLLQDGGCNRSPHVTRRGPSTSPHPAAKRRSEGLILVRSTRRLTILADCDTEAVLTG